jgi:hypothetical protein
LKESNDGGKKSAEIRVQAIKITRGKQKILKRAGVPVTVVVLSELMKTAMAETRKSTKDISMVNGKIKVTPEEFAIVEEPIVSAPKSYLFGGDGGGLDAT